MREIDIAKLNIFENFSGKIKQFFLTYSVKLVKKNLFITEKGPIKRILYNYACQGEKLFKLDFFFFWRFRFHKFY